MTKVIVVVDGPAGCIDPAIESQATAVLSGTPLKFFYYSARQSAIAEKLCLPYLYSWLSWSIGISHATTRHILLHDYDALLLDNSITNRFSLFKESKAKVQGISWYNVNGICRDDRLATTFEAFVDLEWLLGFPPIKMFNQIGYKSGHTRDYDTLLELQHKHLEPEKRAIVPMNEESLVHPTQMIHQYTMFRRDPHKAMPCGSLPMIPFFEWLSGADSAIRAVTQRINSSANPAAVDFFGDGRMLNFSLLHIDSVDWNLKQMVRVCARLKIAPYKPLIDYGHSLYRLVSAPNDRIWRGDFTEEQRRWINAVMPRSA
ncbi:hypothetical protein [Thioalkalivibrio sp. XN279]|uniref:hypothetical protein n=1 Tax=Thioalkalivibrio sp. XN279 TaxID=2714953 RepID=UPI001409B9EB|nr:hypothetical protein [Thioalkalivibrio sp. XN279]NHA15360.1 hypothetical protein [Thioalkalivibrio sp. XN279]